MGFGNARHDHGCKSTEEHECEHDEFASFDLTPFLSLSSLRRATTHVWRQAASNFGKNAQDT